MSRTDRYNGPPKKSRRDRFYADQSNLQRLFEKENPNLRGKSGDPLVGPPFVGAEPVSMPVTYNFSTNDTFCEFCNTKLRYRKVWTEKRRFRWDSEGREYYEPTGEYEIQQHWFHPNLQTQKECKWVHEPKYRLMKMITHGART